MCRQHDGRVSDERAAIRIVATPAAELTVRWTAPEIDSPGYTQKLLEAVTRAAVDVLFASDWSAYGGCEITVTETGWDDVSGSESAMYRAARGALSQLRQQATWELTPLPRR